MAIREIRLEEDPILRKKSKIVKEITPRIKDLISDMKDTMIKANGVGIAAPQVGVLKRIFLIYDENSEIKVFINPRIIKESGCNILNEGCLSVHSITTAYVLRPNTIEVTAFDENLDEFTVILEDFIAREFCHENDHLDGVLYIDKIIEQEKIEKVVNIILENNKNIFDNFVDELYKNDDEFSDTEVINNFIEYYSINPLPDFINDYIIGKHELSIEEYYNLIFERIIDLGE